jgi:hypothetical protein
MIFPKLTFDTVVQKDDMLRLDASLTFSPENDHINDIEIQPEDGEDFISVFVNKQPSKWFIDWAYETSGFKNVSIRVTCQHEVKTKIYTAGINVLDEEEDALLSTDNDLIPFETDILKYLPKGKNSYIYAHRKAQERILAYLDEQRIWKQDNSIYTKLDLVELGDEMKDQFKQWSTFQTLVIIFENLQSSNNDIFQEKKMEYEKLMLQARNRASLRLDRDGDGLIDPVPYNIRTTMMVRR